MRFTNVSAVVDIPASTLRRSRSARSAALIVRGNSAQVIFVGGGDVHGTRHSLAVAGVRGTRGAVFSKRKYTDDGRALATARHALRAASTSNPL